LGHYCLGIIYSRVDGSTIDETKIYTTDDLHSISSVVKDFQFFVVEKWKIASDKGGSGNTANIGSIKNIQDIIHGKGMFHKLGEKWFDDYWINYNSIISMSDKKEPVKINSLEKFIEYKNGDKSLIAKQQKGKKK
jgi:hypothetical protein